MHSTSVMQATSIELQDKIDFAARAERLNGIVRWPTCSVSAAMSSMAVKLTLVRKPISVSVEGDG